jgi:hypothetical protein
MTRTTAKNLIICVVQLLVTEGLVIYPAFQTRHSLAQQLYLRILAPISLLTVAPIWSLQDKEYAWLLLILSIDVAFLSILAFSVIRNHRFVSVVCLFVFNYIGVAFVAGGY